MRGFVGYPSIASNGLEGAKKVIEVVISHIELILVIKPKTPATLSRFSCAMLLHRGCLR